MKIKIQISEGFHTWVLKNSIEIETEDYSELKGMDKKELEEYLNKNSHIPFKEEGKEPDEGWTIFDELINQPDIRNKENNYETHIHVDE